jgi:hypothetical protein
VCGRCSGQHRTTNCKVEDEAQFHCSNCNASGHGATSGACPKYIQQIESVRRKNPYTNYLRFPTDNPRTWSQSLPLPFEQAPSPVDLDEFVTVRRSRQRPKNQTTQRATRQDPSLTFSRPERATTPAAAIPSYTQEEQEMLELANSIPLPPSENSSAVSSAVPSVTHDRTSISQSHQAPPHLSE